MKVPSGQPGKTVGTEVGLVGLIEGTAEGL